jgi:hypothetical protein
MPVSGVPEPVSGAAGPMDAAAGPVSSVTVTPVTGLATTSPR